MEKRINGNLIIIGGAEDKTGDKEILRKVVSCINKDEDILLIATVATEKPEECYKKYYKVFKELKVNNIKKLDIANRDSACSGENVTLIEKSRAIFFTGGDQLRITSVLGGTPVYDAIKDLSEKGGVIAGTSAGASAMSHTMIVRGADEETPSKSILRMSPGLGLIDNVIIDQHFDQRGRMGRLLSGIAQNPEVLGIGIDENTAIAVNRSGVAEVIGTGVVYFIDASSMKYSNVSEQNLKEALSMFNIKLHVLKEGNKFDLQKKLPFEEEI